jgi:hypothetical protein
LRNFFRSCRHNPDIRGCLFRRRRSRKRLLLIAGGAVRHRARGAVHGGGGPIERFGNVGHRALECMSRTFDELPPGFQRPSLFALFTPGARRVSRCLPEKQKRASHVGNFIASIVSEVDVQVPIGDPPHGLAEEAQPAGHAAPHIKPRDKHCPNHRCD